MSAKAPKKSKQHESFWSRHKRLWHWLLGVFLGILTILMLLTIWFTVSPWPGAMVIRQVFEKEGAKTTAALEKHAPSGIAVTSDQQYKPDDKDALLDVYVPETVSAGQKLPVIIWTHGGAWLSGDKANASAYFKLLAAQGFAVVAPNYSLAPDHTYPTPIHQLNTMYSYLIANADRLHADTNRVILAGDSAGSQISAQLAALITNPTYAQEMGIAPGLKPEQLKGVILACGIYKMAELAQANPTLPKIVGWGDGVVVWAYSGTKDFSDPIITQMSPYYHVTKDFPPTFITGGNADPLTTTQSQPFADELSLLGVNVTRLFYDPNHTPTLPHEYQFNLDNADGQNTLNQIITFAKTQTQ